MTTQEFVDHACSDPDFATRLREHAAGVGRLPRDVEVIWLSLPNEPRGMARMASPLLAKTKFPTLTTLTTTLMTTTLSLTTVACTFTTFSTLTTTTSGTTTTGPAGDPKPSNGGEPKPR